LLAATYRSALGDATYSIEYRGPTGTYKSSTASLAQQHFGKSMGLNSSPANWNSTSNALEATLHAAKDTLTLVDDFVPQGTSSDVSQAHKEAERVIRAQGNRQGRQRMGADGEVRPAKPPRGMVLSTGEEGLKQRSAAARMLPVVFGRETGKAGFKGTVDMEVLTACQADADAGIYASAMAGFLKWLSPRLVETKAEVAKNAREMRALAAHPGDHPRTPDIVSDLMAGCDVFLAFAKEIGAINEAQAERHRLTVWDGLMESAADAREENIEAGDPSDRYLSLIRSALNQTKAHIVDISTEDAPAGFESACGWHQELKYQGEAGQALMWVPAANTPMIGWIDKEIVYLDPDAAYNAALRILRERGESLPGTQAIHSQLHDAGKLAKTDSRNKSEGRGRLTCRQTIGGQRRTVLALKTGALWPTRDEEEESGTKEIRIAKVGDVA
jgi:hypothetical protein